MAAGVAAWTVRINLITTSNFGLAANQIANQSSMANARVSALSSSLKRMTGFANAALIALPMIGAVTGAAMLQGIKGAADLQTAMVGIQNATGATTDQLEKLRMKAFDVSAATAQSVVDSAHVMAVMARSGINDPNKLMQIALPAAKFADVQFLSRGVAFDEGAKNAIMLAHLFGAYDPSAATSLFDQMTRLSELMPDNLSRAVTQMGYYVPGLRALNVPQGQDVAIMALLDRMGYGRGKGGTGIGALLREALPVLQLTTHAQAGHNAALEALGLTKGGRSAFYDPKTQSYDFMGMLAQLSSYASSHDRLQTYMAFQNAFKTQGARIADMTMDPNFVAQIKTIQTFMGRKDLGMNEQQARYMNTLNGQFQLFRTNFSSMLTELMWPWLDDLRSTFGFLATKTHELQVWLHSNRGAEKAAGIGLGAVTAVGTVAGVGLLLQTLFKVPVAKAIGGLMMDAFAAIRTGALALAINPAGGLLAFGRALLTIGGRLNPWVGAVLLLVGAVKLFEDHSKDLGKTLGWVAAWIVTKGIPMFKDAWVHGVQTAAQAVVTFINGGGTAMIVGAFQGMWSAIVTFFKSVGNFGSAFGTEYNKDTHGGVTVNVNAPYHAPAHGDDAQHKRHAREHARRVASSVADVLGAGARTGSRSAGSTIASVRMSAFETAGALS